MLFTFGERKLDLAQYPVPDTVKDALWVLWSTNLGLLLSGCFYVAVDSKQGSKLLLEKKMGIVGTGKDRAT